MDFTALTIFFSMLMAGNVDQTQIEGPYGNRVIVTFVFAGAAVTTLAAGTALLMTYGAYNLWGRVMATSDAVGFSVNSKPDLGAPESQAPILVPDVKEDPAVPPVEAQPEQPATPVTPPVEQVVPSSPGTAPGDAPPPADAPISGSGATP